jgi:hypothetical protein
MTTSETHRDQIRRISPPWLKIGNAEKYLYTLGVHLDALGDALVAGVKSRLPGLYSFEALPYIARERRLVRGRNESDEGFANRLRLWLLDHRRRGNPYALLSQLYTYYAPDNFVIDLVYANGRRYSMDVDGAVTRDYIPWSPDGNAAKWARWWLFYNTDQWAVTPPTDTEIDELRLIPRAWNATHPLGYIVLFPSGAELWNYPPGHTWNESGVWNTSGGEVRFITVDDDV